MRKHYLLKFVIDSQVYTAYLPTIKSYHNSGGKHYVMSAVMVNTYKKTEEVITKMIGEELYKLEYQTMINRIKSGDDMTIQLPGIRIEFIEILSVNSTDFKDPKNFI